MLIKLDFYVSYRDGVAFICYDQPVWYDPSIKEALDFSDQNNSDDLLVFVLGGGMKSEILPTYIKGLLIML